MPSTGFIPFKPAPLPAPQPKIGGGGGAVAPIVGPGGQKPTGGSYTVTMNDGTARTISNGVVAAPNKPAGPSIGQLRPAPPLLLASRSTQPALIAGNPKPVTNLLTSSSSLLGGLTKRL